MREMGNLDDALWIANPEYRAGGVSLFIRAFSVEEKPVRATLTITGLGWFASYLNGERTDDEYFKPLLSDYGERSFEDVRFYRPKGGIKRVYYHTFDVAHLLRAGENRLSVAVAAGWYDHREKPVEGNFAYGRPRLIFSLEYETKKGCGRIVSDGNAFVKSLPAAATLFTGETCDYGGAPGEALAARTVPPPGGMLTPAPIACDRIRRLLTPRVLSRGAGRAVLDFGVNHSGFLRGTLTGPKGGCVTVRYAEDLDAEGEIDHTSTSWGVQVQRDEYILSGHTDAVRTEFTYHGYRYAEVAFPPGTEFSLVSAEVCAALPIVGGLECDSDCINRIVPLYLQTQLSNMHGGVPTDCPHRERRGFTGDGYVTCRSALYFLDAEGFYRKWYRDILDSQQPDGYVPHTAPYSGGGGGYGWGYAICGVAETLYDFTGDLSVVKAGCEPMERWVSYMNDRHGGSYVIKREEDNWSLGDWFCADEVRIDAAFVCTCFFLKSVRAVIRFRRLLNQPCEQYEALEARVTAALRGRFYDEKTGSFAGGEQGADALALELGIAPDGEEGRLRANLVERYRKIGAFDTGIFCLLPLCRQLTAAGETALLYRMLTRREYPSYGYMLERGATTLWECWSEKISPRFSLDDGICREGYPVSHNHPMFGSVCAFLFDTLAGLDIAKMGSERLVRYAPRFWRELRQCAAHRETPYGRIAAEYRIEGDTMRCSLEIPAGIAVETDLPFAEAGLRKSRYEVGKYVFEGQLPPQEKKEEI